MIQTRSGMHHLLRSAQTHYAEGNRVEFVTVERQTVDPDLGQGAPPDELRTLLDPEPFIGAVPVNMVRASGGQYLFSDFKLSILKELLTAGQAQTEEAVFYINDERFVAVGSAIETPSSWEFVVRRKKP